MNGFFILSKTIENSKKTWDDIVRQNTEFREEERMSKDLITIGDDGTGDKLCLKVNDGIMGNEIYIWNHEDGVLEEYTPNLKEFKISISKENEVDFEDE